MYMFIYNPLTLTESISSTPPSEDPAGHSGELLLHEETNIKHYTYMLIHVHELYSSGQKKLYVPFSKEVGSTVSAFIGKR